MGRSEGTKVHTTVPTLISDLIDMRLWVGYAESVLAINRRTHHVIPLEALDSTDHGQSNTEHELVTSTDQMNTLCKV